MEIQELEELTETEMVEIDGGGYNKKVKTAIASDPFHGLYVKDTNC